ncbi:hypothetical protein ACTJJ7_15810 [Phyllobacterium sp. 22229]|uniref:hypothetical protein n=1 Tax=Phyllobacterium sp. 22229 TaxID=3453895 RepID=UPI003F859CCC
MKRTLLDYYAKGHLGQYKTWWHLVEYDDGRKRVEHEWEHVRVDGTLESKGTNEYLIDKALLIAPQDALTKLKELIGP